jgi:hypothetical protein
MMEYDVLEGGWASECVFKLNERAKEGWELASAFYESAAAYGKPSRVCFIIQRRRGGPVHVTKDNAGDTFYRLKDTP